MGAVVRPFEWIREKSEEIMGGFGNAFSPKMPETPAVTYTPPETPAEPAGPGTSAEESSEAQKERQRILAAAGKKRTRTLLTSAQGIQNAAGVIKKKLLG